MENDEKQSEDLPKYRLRASAMKTLLLNAHQEGFSEQGSKLFSLLVSNNEARDSVFTFCQTPHPIPLITNIMNLLYDYYSKEKSASQSESKSIEIFQFLNDMISKQLPSSFISRVDINSLLLIDSASRLASLFSSGISQCISNMPTNQNQIAFLLSTLSYCDDISKYISQIQPLISPKTSFSTLTFAELKLLSKHEDIENAPPVKTLISFCKSVPENEIFSYAVPVILSVVGYRLQSNSLKEIPAFITYLIKKSKKGEYLPQLCAFIDKVFEFPDSVNLLRPLQDDLVAFFISNAQSNDVEINDEIKDPTVCANKHIIKTFLNFISRFDIEPFDCLIQTRDTSIGTMILAYSSADAITLSKEENTITNNNINNENNDNDENINLDINSTSSFLNYSFSEDVVSEAKTSEKSKKSEKHKKGDKNDKELRKIDLELIESLLNPLISQNKQSFSPPYQFLIRLCGLCASKFTSRVSLRFLVSAISLGSSVAYDYLINGGIPFDSIFPEIVSNFKPGRVDALYIQALQVLLQDHQPPEVDLPVLSMNESSSGGGERNVGLSEDSDFDDSSYFAKLTYSDDDHSKSGSEEGQINNLSGSPTSETILFCNVVSSVLDFPEFLPLLGPSAASISVQFARDLIRNMQDFRAKKKKKGSLSHCVLSSYSNSIHSLDIQVIYSLASTFLMILPGQSMLFLGISLQRLQPDVIIDALQKVTPFAHSNPVTFGKMVALIAHSYPSIALSFTEGFISSSTTKRRVFFIFKTSETSEDTLVTVFNVIGYCSSFIDSEPFINDFLPFATTFMSKYLVPAPKNQEVMKASLFAIQRMCGHVQKYQVDHGEFEFEFKDFLEDFLTKILKSEVDKIVKINGHSASDNESGNDASCGAQYFAAIILAIASLVPLRPIRTVDKYQPLLMSVATLIQNIKEKSFKGILKSTGILYSRILDSNLSFGSLVSISLLIFPCFLRHTKWIRICRMMSSIYDCYVTKIASSDAIENEKINSLIVNALPLILTEECGQLASQIIFDVVFLFAKFKNQKIDASENDFKELTGEDLRKSFFNFLSKHLMSTQIIDIISNLLETFKDEKLLENNHMNVALTIKYLFEMKRVTDHQVDPKIVSEIISTSIAEKKEVSLILFETIEIISQKSLTSILTVLVSQNSLEKHDKIFDQIIKKIIKNDNSAKSLISYLAENIYNDDNESSKSSILSLAKSTFPLIENAINETEKEIWSKLYVGIVKQTNSIQSPLFRALFKEQDDNNAIKDLYYYANKTAQERPSALPLILSYLPSKVTPFVRKLSLALAVYSKETCHAFLSYSLKDIKSYDKEDIEILIKVISTANSKLWSDLSAQIVQLIVSFIEKSEINIDFGAINANKDDNSNNNNSNESDSNVYCGGNFCLLFAVCFLKSADESGKKLFWEAVVKQASENIQKYARVFLIISFEVDVNIISLIPIVPKLAVSCGSNQDVSLFMQRVYQQLESAFENESKSKNKNDDDSTDDSDDVAMAVLKMKPFSQYKVQFLNKFVEMMINGESVSQCIGCIASYINEIDESTADVIETLITQLPKVNETDQKQISLMLQKVLI